MCTSMFTILSSVVFAVTLAHAQPNLRQRQSVNSTIQWNPCAEAPAPAECALFTYVSTLSLLESPRQPLPYTNSVPLDYANPAAGTTQIAMIRFPAQTLPRRGSIFMNPGSHPRDLFRASSSDSRLSRWPGRERRGLVDGPCLYIPSHRRQRLGCPQFRSA